MKNHIMVEGKLLQTNKKYSDLKQAQRDKIAGWMKDETAAFFDLHKHYPVGRQSEDVIDNVYANIEKAGIWIPYGEVYQHYIAIKTKMIEKL